jgi:hypothetical protein
LDIRCPLPWSTGDRCVYPLHLRDPVGQVGKWRCPTREEVQYQILGPIRSRPFPQRRMCFTFSANEFSMVTIPRARRGERFC